MVQGEIALPSPVPTVIGGPPSQTGGPGPSPTRRLYEEASKSDFKLTFLIPTDRSRGNGWGKPTKRFLLPRGFFRKATEEIGARYMYRAQCPYKNRDTRRYAQKVLADVLRILFAALLRHDYTRASFLISYSKGIFRLGRKPSLPTLNRLRFRARQGLYQAPSQ